MKCIIFIVSIVVSLNYFQFISTSSCPEVCQKENCSPPTNCLSGFVKVGEICQQFFSDNFSQITCNPLILSVVNFHPNSTTKLRTDVTVATFAALWRVNDATIDR